MTESQLVSRISEFGEDLLGGLKGQSSLSVNVLQRRGPCKVRVLYAAGELGAEVEKQVKNARHFREAWQRAFPVNQMVLMDPEQSKRTEGGEVNVDLWLFNLEVTDG